MDYILYSNCLKKNLIETKQEQRGNHTRDLKSCFRSPIDEIHKRRGNDMRGIRKLLGHWYSLLCNYSTQVYIIRKFENTI